MAFLIFFVVIALVSLAVALFAISRRRGGLAIGMLVMTVAAAWGTVTQWEKQASCDKQPYRTSWCG